MYAPAVEAARLACFLTVAGGLHLVPRLFGLVYRDSSPAVALVIEAEADEFAVPALSWLDNQDADGKHAFFHSLACGLSALHDRQLPLPSLRVPSSLRAHQVLYSPVLTHTILPNHDDFAGSFEDVNARIVRDLDRMKQVDLEALAGLMREQTPVLRRVAEAILDPSRQFSAEDVVTAMRTHSQVTTASILWPGTIPSSLVVQRRRLEGVLVIHTGEQVVGRLLHSIRQLMSKTELQMPVTSVSLSSLREATSDSYRPRLQTYRRLIQEHADAGAVITVGAQPHHLLAAASEVAQERVIGQGFSQSASRSLFVAVGNLFGSDAANNLWRRIPLGSVETDVCVSVLEMVLRWKNAELSAGQLRNCCDSYMRSLVNDGNLGKPVKPAEIRLFTVGEGRAGKTTLLHRLSTSTIVSAQGSRSSCLLLACDPPRSGRSNSLCHHVAEVHADETRSVGRSEITGRRGHPRSCSSLGVTLGASSKEARSPSLPQEQNN